MQTILQELRALKPLSKPHLSWPFPVDHATRQFPMWQPQNRELLHELVRLTGSIPLSVEFHTESQLEIVAQEFRGTPVCITCNPYRAMLAKNLPPTVLSTEWQKDVTDLSANLRRIAERIDPASVHWAYYDIENWSGHNQSPLKSTPFMLCQGMTLHLFPSAQVLFYGHGGFRWQNSDEVYVPIPYVPPGCEGGEYLNVSMYYPELTINHECVRRTLAVARDQRRQRPLSINVSLASSYQPTWSSNQAFRSGGIGVGRAWRYGFEINHPWAAQPVRRYRYAMSAAELVYLYPSMGSDRPGYLREFVAYMQGAHNIPLAPETAVEASASEATAVDSTAIESPTGELSVPSESPAR